MGGIALEEMTLVKIGTILWIGSEVKKLMRKNSSGLINMEKVVPLLTEPVSKFPISTHLKNRLIDVIEKIGYELYSFLTKTYIDCDFDVEIVKWTIDGLINGSETLREFLARSRKYTISQFRFSCELFDEPLVREIWSKFDENDRKIHRESCHVFATYWIGVIEDDLVSDSSAPFIIGFKRTRSLEVNMLWHSIAVSNRAAIRYFIRKLRESDFLEFGLTDSDATEHDILQFLLKNPNEECFPFVLGFLETPIPSDEARKLIIEKMDAKLIKGFLDYVLRRVNICGDLHHKIFRYLIFSFRYKWTIDVRDNLHLYALNLLSKGRIEKFEFFPDVKNILLRQIIHKLKCKSGLGIFVTIHWNNYTNLLSQFLEWLADSQEDREFFMNFVSAIVDGRQYDL